MSATLQQIWKFPLPSSEWADIEMPAGAQVLHVDEQSGTICVWALVSPATRERVVRRFRIVGTGWPISDLVGQHVGTVLVDPHVWHVFEEQTRDASA